MDQLKQEERELIKLVQFFKKRGEILIIENKLGDEHKQLLDTCDKLVEQINQHAKLRATVLSEREQLTAMVRDNASCPKCNSNEMIKLIGVEKSPEGWKSNKYKCRRCNISFVWNTPNNPWDMIPYVEKFVSDLQSKLQGEQMDPALREQTELSLAQMKQNVLKLKPIVEASDKDLQELEERESQMAEMVHKFKKHLLIEKIRMED